MGGSPVWHRPTPQREEPSNESSSSPISSTSSPLRGSLLSHEPFTVEPPGHRSPCPSGAAPRQLTDATGGCATTPPPVLSGTNARCPSKPSPPTLLEASQHHSRPPHSTASEPDGPSTPRPAEVQSAPAQGDPHRYPPCLQPTQHHQRGGEPRGHLTPSSATTQPPNHRGVRKLRTGCPDSPESSVT
jgi:hypothetical protein